MTTFFVVVLWYDGAVIKGGHSDNQLLLVVMATARVELVEFNPVLYLHLNPPALTHLMYVF